MISWDEPEFPNGIVDYTLALEGTNIASGAVVLNQSVTTNCTEYLLNDVQPYSNYTVVITSRTTIGEGDPVTITFETPEGSKELCLMNNIYIVYSRVLQETETEKIMALFTMERDKL